jgi:hypothetical protein
MVAIWPFLTAQSSKFGLFLKWFARNKMIWPFGQFLAFLKIKENSIHVF